MKKFLKVLLGIFISFLIVFSYSSIVNATTTVSGWAWSSTIGWISFSSTNCDTDGDGIFEGTGEHPDFPPPPANCPTTGTAYAYGVNIEVDGNMTGYAWSANIGWIHFDPVVPGYFTPTHSAKIDTITGEVSGWARAVVGGAPEAGGWDGWISMRGTITGHPDYGVSLNKAGEFHGWAWGGDPQGVDEAVIGWISFNHLNCDPDENGFSDGISGCPAIGTVISAYQVTTTFEIAGVPSAEDLTETASYCGIAKGKGGVWLSWLYQHTGNKDQAKYHLQIATDDGFEDLVVNKIAISRAVDKTTVGTVVEVVENPTPGEIDFNTIYYWRIKVKDVDGIWSDWATGTSFTTQAHASPWPDFEWSPIRPVIDETVYFTDTSVCFGLGGVTTTCSSFWDFGARATPTHSTSTNPTTTFAEAGRYTVELTVTCPAGFSCTRVKTIDVAVGPPEWIEIPPVIWFREFWADAVDTVNGFRVRVIDFVNNLWG